MLVKTVDLERLAKAESGDDNGNGIKERLAFAGEDAASQSGADGTQRVETDPGAAVHLAD